MNILSHKERGFDAGLERLFAPSSLFDPAIERQTRAILDAVQARGDDAVIEFTERFGGPKLRADQFAVSHAELMTASLQAGESLRSAVRDAQKNVEAFARRSLRKDWQMRNSHGAIVGEKFDPFHRVGVYIPGGAAPLASTALMTIPLARVAGCKEIVVCTPSDKQGQINPAVLYAARHAGATEIYRIGGSQAICAMVFGTPTIKRVQKIFGPGNAYVVAAKRLLFGYAAMDLLPGPSEVLVLADETANAAYAAADLLAQAEHGSGHERVWLVTTSPKLVQAVEKELIRQAANLKRPGFIQKILASNTWLIHVANMSQAIDITNRLAPEHLEIMTRQAGNVARKITTAGAIFLGNDSPTVLGDYVAGPSHTLPTGGAGASFAGLTVDQFQRRASIVEYKKSALKKALKSVQTFARMEGLDAHGHSAEIRVEK
jgi:histidinol dehydrogenase